ncbi:MAG: hypothetical protein GY754_35460 [bacterium]|nr:hypothetical protein [bacterium]
MNIEYSEGSISSDDVLKYLSLTGRSREIYIDMIKIRIAGEKAKELGVTAKKKNLQKYADDFRKTNRLLSADDTYAFLKNAGLTEDDFEAFCESLLVRDLVKDKIADKKKIEEYFATNKPVFDEARISHIVVDTKNLAQELIMQITEDDEDFHALAREHSLDEKTAPSGGYVGQIYRHMLSPETATKVFNASDGEILGPFKRDKLHEIILVEKITKADLKNDTVRELVKETIFNEWIAQFVKEGVRVEA